MALVALDVYPARTPGHFVSMSFAVGSGVKCILPRPGRWMETFKQVMGSALATVSHFAMAWFSGGRVGGCGDCASGGSLLPGCRLVL